MFKPSEQQLSAINTEHKSLLVYAAAGSGKTAVLTQRALRMISDEALGIPADTVLILTFTNAAAAELRARLANGLHSAQTAYLRRQRLLLGRAHIGTLDALCKALCSEYFTVLGIKPDFTVGEKDALEVMQVQAMQQTLDTVLCEPKFARFASGFPRARSSRQLEESILLIHDALVRHPDPEQYAEQLKQTAKATDIDGSALGGILLNHAADVLSGAVRMYNGATQLVGEESGAEKLLSVLQIEKAQLEEAAQAAKGGGYDDCRRALFAVEFARMPTAKSLDPDTKQTIKLLRDRVKAIVTELKEKSFYCDKEQIAADNAVHFDNVCALCDAAIFYRKTLLDIKRCQDCYDFYDLQHFTAHLFTQQNLPVCRRYNIVMVDEYQDTNKLAEHLYRCFSAHRPHNLFLVGDVKQSIYGFNSARPDIFTETERRFNESDDAQVVYLSKNFRSAPSVIGTVNDLFGAIMSRHVGGVDYDANNRLYPGREHTPDTGVMLTVTEGESDALEVAQLCARLIAKGREPEQICILLRSAKRAPEYSAALNALGVPSDVFSANDLTSEPGVMPLVSMLKLLCNPFSEVELAAVLLSPLGGFTADELCALYETSPSETPDLRLMLRLRQSDTQKAARFIATYDKLRRTAGTVSVRRLLQCIYDATNAYILCSALSPGASECIAELEALAVSYDSVGQNGLFGFVRRLDSLSSSGARAARKGFVHIMTIHRSKGLEYPVCILADLSREFNYTDFNPPILHSDLVGIGMKVATGMMTQGDTLWRRAVSLVGKNELQSEELRILYVAATRAREQLYAFVALKDAHQELSRAAAYLYGSGGLTPTLVSESRNFARLVLYFALLHPDGGALRKLGGAATLPIMTASGRLDVVTEQAPPPPTLEHADPPADTAQIQRLVNGFAFTYPDIEQTTAPIKTGVTELLFGQKGESAVRVPSFSTQQASGAQRGTATHEFLQLCDFSAAQKDIDCEIERLVSGAFIKSEDAELLNRAKLREFFVSRLAQRVIDCTDVYREYEFITNIDGLFVQGIADLVIVEEDGAVLVDYKTDSVSDVAQLVQKYRPQLKFYCDAVERRLGVGVKEAIIYSISLNRTVVL